MAPFELSNTAVLEQCFGWEGICVEPNPQQHTLFLSYRTCRLVPFCVGENTGNLKTFGVPEGSTGHGRQVDVPIEKSDVDDVDKTRINNRVLDSGYPTLVA